jgi:hypothetical protein
MTCLKWAGAVAPHKSQNVCQKNNNLRYCNAVRGAAMGRRGTPRGRHRIPMPESATKGQAQYLPVRLLGDWVAQGVGGRLAAPWFRIHPAECRVGRPVPTKSGALPLRGDRVVQGGKLQAGVDGLVTRHSPLVTRHCPSQFVLGIGRGFVIEGKAHGHKSSDP